MPKEGGAHRKPELPNVPAIGIRCLRWTFQQEVPFYNQVKYEYVSWLQSDWFCRLFEQKVEHTQHVSLVDEDSGNMWRRAAQKRLQNV